MRTFETQDNTAECVGLCMLAAIWFPSCGFCRFYFGFVSISMCVCVRARIFLSSFLHSFYSWRKFSCTYTQLMHGICVTVFFLLFSFSLFYLPCFIHFIRYNARRQADSPHACDMWLRVFVVVAATAVCCRFSNQTKIRCELDQDFVWWTQFWSLSFYLSLFSSFTWNSIETLLTN